MLIRHAVRLAVISVFLFFQCLPPVFAVPAKVGTYDQLVAAIREVRVESQKRVEQAVAQEKVREAWETGKLIDEHVLQHKERADYDQQVLVRLASDLGTSKTELYYMLEFARAYPIFPHAGKLSWSEYRDLLAVDVPEKREALAAQAEKENWNRSRLRKEIRNVAGKKPEMEQPLTAKPGIVGTYRVVKTPKGVLVLDLGFSDYFASARTARLKEGNIVKFEKERFEKSPAGTEALYTYQVDVTEVVDGDTFKAAIPLGFGFTTVQKLRLRGLDAPEIASADGQEAKAFLEERFAKTKTPVLIRTVKSDKYDRYLADVWVENRYLNQELLDEGLAVRVEE